MLDLPQPIPALLVHNWTLGYPMTPRTVRLARLHVHRRLTMWNWPGDIEDAVLVTSELVANAVVHGRIPGHELRLRIAEADDHLLTIEVSDPVPTFPEVRPRSLGERGRGLIVVQQLADSLDWFLRAGVGKTVRAQLSGPKD
ncbi:ATP-binding protein [Streptomyces geranii]|uniref:ATP-binding protein n=1 Tax=Streptomyces geranii TaxID=2058923 RepID=UPI000D038BAD|nr:ATP-binding protein [Streptomyces geranii]